MSNKQLYMVVETFKPGKKDAVYKRFETSGRMLSAAAQIYHQLGGNRWKSLFSNYGSYKSVTV